MAKQELTFGAALVYAMDNLSLAQCMHIYEVNVGIDFEGNIRMMEIAEFVAQYKFEVNLETRYQEYLESQIAAMEVAQSLER